MYIRQSLCPLHDVLRLAHYKTASLHRRDKMSDEKQHFEAEDGLLRAEEMRKCSWWQC